MNHSLLSADRTTHLKIVAVSLIAAIIVVAVGITARIAGNETATTRVRTDSIVVKAGTPATFTRTDGSTIR